MTLDASRLITACSDDGFDAGITITTRLEPVAGPGAPVKPAIYSGGVYQHDRRWWDLGEGTEKVAAIVIDNVPSQANRLEAALAANRDRLGLPEIVLDLSSFEHLPVHLPRQISSFLFPHRNADSYLRDAELDGSGFLKTEVGKRLFGATATQPAALFEWMPQALLFGFWQSHLGTKRAQTKLARSWVSEIVGLDPATTDTKALGVKGDPLNLSIDTTVAFDEADVTGWQFADEAKKGATKERLSEIGHGQVPVEAPTAAVSFRAIVQQSTVSFAGLRRIEADTGEANAAGRALLAAMGLVAHVAAFGRPFSLRSGCDLRPVESEWTWRGESEDSAIEPLDLGSAEELFMACATAAEGAGLPVGSQWPDPLLVAPGAGLARVIERAWPNLDAD